MPKVRELKPAQLYHRCDPKSLSFKTTEDLPDLKGILGQERAVDAIDFGIKIQQDGYNLFAMGPAGTGKHTILSKFLDARANSRDGVYDWCYVHNFEDPYKPLALRLPPGTGREFEDTITTLVEDLITSIPAAFEREEFQAQIQKIESTYSEREQKPFEDLQARARKRDIALTMTQNGVSISPIKDGESMPTEEFEKLSEDTQADLTALMKGYHDELEKIIMEAPKLRREMRRKIRKLNELLATEVVAELFSEVRKKYADHEFVTEYLEQVQADVVESADAFRPAAQEQQQGGIMLPGMASPEDQLKSIVDRYRVNRLIDHRKTEKAPVVYCDNPTFENLVGSIEHMAEMGNLVTNFTLIKAGALHQANGGYLIIDAQELLRQPSAWDGLKRALRSNHIHTEPLGRYLSMVSTVSLEPQPIPLKIKVILVGERNLYYALRAYDSDFTELFKVVADFEDSLPRKASTTKKYAQMIATVARRSGLRPFDKSGVCRLIEHGSRLAGDSRKLSVQMIHIADLAREADFHAGEAKAKVTTAEHISKALDSQEHRNGRYAELMRERVDDGTVMIDTKGERVGQINALSVYQVGGTAFGQPNRITSSGQRRQRPRHGHRARSPPRRKTPLQRRPHPKLLPQGAVHPHQSPIPLRQHRLRTELRRHRRRQRLLHRALRHPLRHRRPPHQPGPSRHRLRQPVRRSPSHRRRERKDRRLLRHLQSQRIAERQRRPNPPRQRPRPNATQRSRRSSQSRHLPRLPHQDHRTGNRNPNRHPSRQAVKERKILQRFRLRKSPRAPRRVRQKRGQERHQKRKREQVSAIER